MPHDDQPPLPAALWEPRPPWTLRLEGARADAYQAVRRWSGSGATCRVLRGWKMRTEQGVFDELAAALQFPDYFGENWDAVDECLTDLSWLPGRAYVLVIAAADELLVEEPAERLALFLNLLGRGGEEWARPVEAGEWWDRPAIGFHVVLHTEPAARDRLLSRLPGQLPPAVT